MMKASVYKYAILLFIVQLAVLVVFLDNNLMKKYDFFQSIPQVSLELLLGIGFFALNISAIFVLRNLYLSMMEAQHNQVMAIRSEYIAEQNRLYNLHRHDLQNHLSVMAGLLSRQDYQNLGQYLSFYSVLTEMSMINVSTGSNEVDILIYAKMQEAEAKQICVEFKCCSAIKCEQYNILNLISIFSNVLDNAIEACAFSIGNHRPRILIILKEDPLDYIFEVSNTLAATKPVSTELIFAEGFSTKDGDSRGQGLAIVQRLVGKFEGEAKVDIQDNLFKITIELPKHNLGG